MLCLTIRKLKSHQINSLHKFYHLVLKKKKKIFMHCLNMKTWMFKSTGFETPWPELVKASEGPSNVLCIKIKTRSTFPEIFIGYFNILWNGNMIKFGLCSNSNFRILPIHILFECMIWFFFLNMKNKESSDNLMSTLQEKIIPHTYIRVK